jgi:ribosomal protein S18 acetylase RimI-like enzyme
MLGHHPYRDLGDIERMRSLLSAGNAASPDCGYMHPGDLEWRVFTPHRYPLSELIEIWEDGDAVAGFGFLESESGFSWQVLPERRGTDLDLEILRWCVDATLRWRSGSGLAPLCTTETFADDTASNRLLESAGFRRTEAGWIGFRRSLEALPELRMSPGSVARGVRDEDIDSRASCQFEAFAPGSRTTAESWRAMMVNAAGYERSLDCVVVSADGLVAAGAMCWTDHRNKTGLFAPVATRPSYQRQGYGRALMLYGLHALREQGMTSAIVSTNRTNVAAEALYRSVGFIDRNRGFEYEYRPR